MKKFALYRILGNDLPPRHNPDQTLRNLLFMLKHEPAFPDCEKRWVVNRIADKEQERKIILLLDQHRQKYIHIPFVLAEYAQCRHDINGLPQELFQHKPNAPPITDFLRGKLLEYPFRHKNLYAMNNNGARNAALAEGRTLAEWIMPWDGCCFVSAAAWAALLSDMASVQDNKYLIVPMVRTYNNLSVLDQVYVPDPDEEPQIAFHRNALECFDEQLRYGYSPKAELLRRLQVPGPWCEWGKVPWEIQEVKSSCEAGKYHQAGWVARLFSGLPSSQDDDMQRHTRRIGGIVNKLSELDEQVLRQKFNPDNLVFYDAAVLYEYKQAWIAGQARTGGIVGKLLRDAASHVETGVADLELKLASPHTSRCNRTDSQPLIDHTVLMALAWYFSDDSRFADRAAHLLRTGFLDPASGMHPHLEYAQTEASEAGGQPGDVISDIKGFYYFLDAVRLIFRSGKLSLSEQQQFRQWCRKFLDWLLNSTQGKFAYAAQNYQGTYYDLQVAALTAFLDETQIMLRVLRVSSMRSVQQFHPDGSQPEELKRSDSLHYSVFNLHGWFNLNKLAVLAGMDLWNTSTYTSGCPATGLSWLLSFQREAWPYPQQRMFDFERLSLLQYLACPDKRAQGSKPDAVVIDPQEIKPVFHPDAGVLPYWIFGHSRSESIRLNRHPPTIQ